MWLKAVQAFINTPKDARAITQVRTFIFDIRHTDMKSQLLTNLVKLESQLRSLCSLAELRLKLNLCSLAELRLKLNVSGSRGFLLAFSLKAFFSGSLKDVNLAKLTRIAIHP